MRKIILALVCMMFLGCATAPLGHAGEKDPGHDPPDIKLKIITVPPAEVALFMDTNKVILDSVSPAGDPKYGLAAMVTFIAKDPKVQHFDALEVTFCVYLDRTKDGEPMLAMYYTASADLVIGENRYSIYMDKKAPCMPPPVRQFEVKY